MKRVVVTTGANGGLGRALVREFARNNWHVVATGRSEASDELEDIEYHQFDAADSTVAADFWKKMKSRYGEAEICLINNAGSYVSGGLLELSSEQYEEQMHSNYFAAVYMTRGLVEAFDKARIINVISSSALAAHAKNSAYGAAKAAEQHFFQALQKEYKLEKYQITNLYPQNIASEGPATTPEDLAEFVRTQAENTKSYYLPDVTIYPR